MHKLSLKLLAGEDGLHKEVTGCYIGDLLSWVMGRAAGGDAWLTIIGNVNAIAVAALADTSCIILTENSYLDKEAAQKADQQGIAVLSCTYSSYKAAVRIHELLQ